ncbi:flagella assembly protein FlgT middle domain-containing protein [Paraglaciecola sp. 2405UD69-4]|uniref:flagella assembly protein FlgT middle domain-containing protein n=1 Tax=Paraglaciecola sp. 2405UD69-4 TaxID=3391836 RepID=UPI0039C968AE
MFSYGPKALVALLLLSFSATVTANWQQGEASVAIEGADLTDVRVQAIKNAVADASFKNGSFIAAEDVVLDGLLISSKSVITTQGQIQRVEVMSETVTDDILKVVVKVSFSPLFNCAHDGYNRSMLVAQFQVLKPQQAKYGSIFDLGKQISKRFERQLSVEHNSPKVLLIDKAFTDVNSYDKIDLQEITDKAIYMTREYGRQFVLFGFIRDISLFEQVTEELLTDDVSLRRNFTIQVYLLDAYKHNILYKETYHSEADWEYSSDYSVDTNNSLFWRSDYGRVVLNTINMAVSDVSNLLQCERSFAQVINTEQQSITINMGAENGIKKGDKFTLYKKRLPIGVNGMSHSTLRSYPAVELEVKQVDSTSSVLDMYNPNQFINIELLDLVSPTR